MGAVYAAIGILFTAIAFVALVSLVSVKTRADITLTTTSTTATNAPPTAENLIVSDKRGLGDISKTGFTPNEGGYKTLFVRGKVFDPNGCSDIRRVEIKVYRSGVGNLCQENFNNCYGTSTESLIACGKSTYASFEAGIDLKYYAEPTDAGSQYENQYWFAEATAIDSALRRYTSVTNFEVNSLAAIEASTSTFSFGTVDLGAVSNEAMISLSNAGNRDVLGAVRADSDLKSNLPGFSQVSSSQVHISFTKGFAWGAGAPIQTTSDLALPMSMAKQLVDYNIVSLPVYFRIKMPERGVSGTYSNNLIFTAKAF